MPQISHKNHTEVLTLMPIDAIKTHTVQQSRLLDNIDHWLSTTINGASWKYECYLFCNLWDLS